MASRKNTVDWSRIELEYLAGEDSVREIADRHEISHTAIQKRAKAAGWVRPVATGNQRQPAAKPRPTTAAPVTDQPAESPVIADRGRRLVARMLDELDAITSHAGELEEAIIAETMGDRTSDRRATMMKAVSLDGRANTLKTLSLALKTINEASAPQGKKAAAQEKATEIGRRFTPLGPPTLKAVK